MALIAQRDKVPRFVRPLVGPVLDVMHVQVLAQSTTAAFPAITLQNALHESMVCLSRKSQAQMPASSSGDNTGSHSHLAS